MQDKTDLRVLYFAPRECWPPNTGAKLRNYYLARELGRRARVSYLSFTDEGAQPTHPAHATEVALPAPDQLYEQVVTVPRGRGYTPGKIARGALGRTPLPVLNYTTGPMRQALGRILAAHEFAAAQVESIHLISYLPLIRAARSRPLTLCDWHNVESELMRRYSAHAPGVLRRLYARRTARQLATLERRALHDFDAHLTVSARDRERLLEVVPEARVFVIENGVDISYFTDERIQHAHDTWQAEGSDSMAVTAAVRPTRTGDADRRRLVFVGSMDYHANVDAATHFAREVWPRLYAQRAELVFTIVGRAPAPEVRALAELPGIEVTGTVADVRPYYREALGAVIPLRVGGGSRLKILEAMAAGVPVVSTTLGAEGLAVRNGENIFLADTAEELAHALIGLIEHEAQRRQLTEAARQLVAARYDWTSLGAKLSDTYRSLIERRQAARAITS